MLDTNVLVHIVNHRGYWRSALKSISRQDVEICVSAVSYFELASMISAARTGKDKAQQLADIVGRFKIEPFNKRAAEAASQLQVHLEKSGKGIGQRDAMITGHAKHLDCICVTHNENEFNRVHGLKVENWIGD